MSYCAPGADAILDENKFPFHHHVDQMEKWVYTFGDGCAEGDASMADLLGGKGANLAEMCTLGLPVPPGLTITTQASNWYYANEM